MNRLRQILKGERGFTLVEMIVVIAIMGVMTAVAVPVVTNNLSKSKERAYAQDLAMIQTSIDSYFTAADNIRHLGLRQYPINGGSATGTTKLWDGSASIFEPLANPLLGTKGGQPYWRDDGDGERENTEESLYGETLSEADQGLGGWYVTKVDLQGVEYAVDTRDYFIDFSMLVSAGLLKASPESASSDNGGVASGSGGSYGWFVNANGSVDSILSVFPYNGLNFDGTAIVIGDVSASDLRGFQAGIYP